MVGLVEFFIYYMRNNSCGGFFSFITWKTVGRMENLLKIIKPFIRDLKVKQKIYHQHYRIWTKATDFIVPNILKNRSVVPASVKPAKRPNCRVHFHLTCLERCSKGDFHVFISIFQHFFCCKTEMILCQDRDALKSYAIPCHAKAGVFIFNAETEKEKKNHSKISLTTGQKKDSAFLSSVAFL